MAKKKKISGNTKVLSDDWEEFIRQIRSQTAVDFTMTSEEKAKKLRELEANPLQWIKFMFYTLHGVKLCIEFRKKVSIFVGVESILKDAHKIKPLRRRDSSAKLRKISSS